MKLKESEVLWHFQFQEFLKFQELSHPCWVPQFFLDNCIVKENSCQARMCVCLNLPKAVIYDYGKNCCVLSFYSLLLVVCL